LIRRRKFLVRIGDGTRHPAFANEIASFFHSLGVRAVIVRSIVGDPLTSHPAR
jgi:hypothetical protein